MVKNTNYADECIGAAFCSKDELDQFTALLLSPHFIQAITFTWEISEISVAFLDINISSIKGKGLSTSAQLRKLFSSYKNGHALTKFVFL